MGHKGGPWLVHEECVVCIAAWQKAPEGMSNSGKIKPVALAIVRLHNSEGISQAVSLLVS